MAIEWYDHLYVGNRIGKDRNRILADIHKGRFTINIYVIAFAINPQNQLDIYNANELRQKYYREQNIRVVGIARGRKEAFRVVEQMVMEAYQITGDPDLREYISW